jgi:hypothetical protein
MIMVLDICLSSTWVAACPPCRPVDRPPCGDHILLSYHPGQLSTGRLSLTPLVLTAQLLSCLPLGQANASPHRSLPERCHYDTMLPSFLFDEYPTASLLPSFPLFLRLCPTHPHSPLLHKFWAEPPSPPSPLLSSSTSLRPVAFFYQWDTPIFLLIFVYSDAMLPCRWCCCLLALGPLRIFLTCLVSQPRAWSPPRSRPNHHHQQIAQPI